MLVNGNLDAINGNLGAIKRATICWCYRQIALFAQNSYLLYNVFNVIVWNKCKKRLYIFFFFKINLKSMQKEGKTMCDQTYYFDLDFTYFLEPI